MAHLEKATESLGLALSPAEYTYYHRYMGSVSDIECVLKETLADQSWRRQVYARLETQEAVQLKLTERHDCLFPSLCRPGRLLLHGRVGDYAFAYNELTDVTVDGGAGKAFGLGMRSGILHVHGQVGALAGFQASGGSIVVNGNCDEEAAAFLQGADVCVLGNVSRRAGLRMKSGALVIQGDADEELGHGATGGIIYIMGQVKSSSSSVYESRMKEPDRLRLSLILARTNITAKPKDFRVFKPEVAE